MKMNKILLFFYTPMSSSLTLFWNFGSMLGMVLVSQILSGILLAIYFTTSGEEAFSSVQHIMYEVNFGWMLRLLHFNGANLFFLFLFLHMLKGLFLGSFRLKAVWTSGLLLLILVMGAAFFGYVVVWAQMSYWACNVITNLISVIPLFGPLLILWVWGGFSVNSATLGLLFVLHFLFPFIVFMVMVGHILLLHSSGSTSNMFAHGDYAKIPFHSYFTVKDTLNLNYWIMFLMFVFLFPWYLGDAEMFVEANPTASPVHIVPEWYFLYVYAILRSIPNKIIGVVALALSFVVFFLLPTQSHYNNFFDVMHYCCFWWLTSTLVILTWIGGKSVEAPFTEIGLASSFIFFLLVFLMSKAYSSSEMLYK